MPKALQATCVGGVVTVGALPVAGATVLSEGVGPSSGLLVLDGELAVYLAKTSPDLKTALTAIASALGQIATTLASIGAAMTGPTTAPPPTLAVDLAALTVLQGQLSSLKEILK